MLVKIRLIPDCRWWQITIKSVSEESWIVDFYAPVFAGKEYRFVRAINDYSASFNECLQELKDIKPFFFL